MNRYEKDGNVAVLISPGYGAGWSTWADEDEQHLLLFDPAIVEIVLEHQADYDRSIMEKKIENIFSLKSYSSYMGGIRDLEVVWVPKGTAFQIREYDGSESIVLKENDDWFVA